MGAIRPLSVHEGLESYRFAKCNEIKKTLGLREVGLKFGHAPSPATFISWNSMARIACRAFR